MLSRVSILSFVVTLSILLFGECRAESANMHTTPLLPQVEVTIVDADNPNSTSLLSGRDSSRMVNNNSRRTMQRTACKRTCSANIAVKAESESLIIEHSYNTYKPNILGGVVADRAFYSLCCLRI